MREKQIPDTPLKIRKLCKPECSSHQIVNSDGREVSFVIYNVTVNDSGTYGCSWNNSDKNASYRYVLIGRKLLSFLKKNYF